MRPGQQQQNKQRMRGRGRKGPNPLSRSYESNGPDVKIRGTAQHIAEKYTTLARDASASGDRVMAENYLQHAEHYGRIVAAAQGSFTLQRDEREIEYDEDGEEIFEEGGFNGQTQPDVQPPQMRENQPRENGYRDNQREGQQRDGQQQRDNNQPRDNGQPRDNYQRDGQPRDRAHREGNRADRDGNREFSNRDGNRAERGETQNRDNGQNRQRDFNRENRNDRGNREPRENRDGQADRNAAQVPGGLGPQPFIGLPPAAPVAAEPQAQPAEMRRDDETRRDDAVTTQPAVEATAAPVAPGEGAQRAEGEPRRRGRPRRIRLEDREAQSLAGAEAPQASSTVEAPVADLQPAIAATPEPAAEAPAAATPASAGEEVKVKRRPGRPRKKKPEDEASEEGGDHMPAFLMASNG